MSKMIGKRGTRAAGVAACVLTAAAAGTNPARAAFLPVYGGLSYDPATSTGYTGGNVRVTPGSGVNASGTAVGSATKVVSGASNGERAAQWNSAGATEMSNLGTNGTTTTSRAYAINATGVTVGQATKYVSGVSKGDRAVRWDAGGTIAELDTLGADGNGVSTSQAVAVNASGMAAGIANKYVSGADKGQRAVRWDASGAITELPNLGTDSGGSTTSQAYALNASGVTVGYSFKYAGTFQGYRATRWDAAGAVTELATLGTDSTGFAGFSVALAINPTGTAAGYATKYVGGVDVGTRGATWNAATGAVTELADLGTNGSGSTNAYVYALSASGVTGGQANKYVGGVSKGYRAVRWDAAGAVTELALLGTDSNGLTDSSVYALSDAGAAVGYANKYVGGTNQGNHAMYWAADGTATDLNDLIDPASGWVLRQARAISATGDWVAGYGLFDPDGAGPQAAYQRTFVMQVSVPEPMSMAVLGVGAAAILMRRRRTTA